MVETLFGYFVRYGYWVVFFGVSLENAGLPIPGETILLGAGFFAARGHFSLLAVIGVALLGAVMGDNIGYAVGRNLGRSALVRYGHYVFLTPARMLRLDTFFARYGNKTIFVARFVTGLRVFAALFAGAAQMSWGSFFSYNVAGAILWAITISLVGFFFGEHWDLLETWIRRSGFFGLLAVVAILVGRWVYVKRGKRKRILNS
jgi:membrane protein DedA with SNARE-associated domain